MPCPFENFVARLNAAGSALEYGTYLGGRAGELSGGIAVDGDGDAYVDGHDALAGLPDPQRAPAGDRGRRRAGRRRACRASTSTSRSSTRAAAHRVSAPTSAGTDNERSGGVAVDRYGRVYLTGSTASADFPTADPVQDALDTARAARTSRWSRATTRSSPG